MYKFKNFIEPIKVEEFFQRYWRKEPLLIKKQRDTGNILTLEDINDFLSGNHFNYPTVRMISSGKELDLDNYCFDKNSPFKTLDKNAVFRSFEEGNTIVIQAAQTIFPNVYKLLNSFEEDLAMEMNANVYITPSNMQGFHPHFDTHEVLVLQIDGYKVWNIYDCPSYAPIPGMQLTEEQRQHYIQSVAEHQINLEPGDILYIPRGVVHDASSELEMSIHITIGITPKLRSYYLKQLFAFAEREPFFREPFDLNDPREEEKIWMQLEQIAGDISLSGSIIKSYQQRYFDSEDLFNSYYTIDNMDSVTDLSLFTVNVIGDIEKISDLEKTAIGIIQSPNDIESMKFQDLKAVLKSLVRTKVIELDYKN